MPVGEILGVKEKWGHFVEPQTWWVSQDWPMKFPQICADRALLMLTAFVTWRDMSHLLKFSTSTLPYSTSTIPQHNINFAPRWADSVESL